MGAPLMSRSISAAAMAVVVSCLLSLALWPSPGVATEDGLSPGASDGESSPRSEAPEVQTLLAAAASAQDGLTLASRQQGARGHRTGASTGTLAQGRPVWDWPLAGQPPVVHRFDAPVQRWLPGHRGVDLGGFAGEPVRSVADGVVAYSGVIAGVGVVSVQHPDGLRSTYQPLLDRVARGERVRSGQVLGALDGGGHCALRACLHLGAKRGDAYLDPLLLLQPWEVSLLPLD